MAAEPHHPMMHLAMSRIIINVMNIDALYKPKLIFVTGPHDAVKNAYTSFLAPTCCNGDIQEKLFKNDVVLQDIGKESSEEDFSRWLDYCKAPIQRHRALQCNIECHAPGTTSNG